RETAMPAPIEFARSDESQSYFATDILARTSVTRVLLNARDILGDEAFDNFRDPFFIEDEKDRQIYNQRRALIASFMVDQYGSRARGNRVFLLAWGDVSPSTENMGSQTYSAVDTTLYIIELSTEITPTTEEITVSKDQFTWTALPESQIGNISPANLNTSLLDNNIVAFRFTPIEGARLEEVTGLTLLVERTSTSTTNALELWDWEQGEWVEFRLGGQSRYEVTNFERFIGVQNAVQIRTTTGVSGGSRYIQQLGIEQRGRMS
ncbi:MAG: hypothetical protein KJ043_13655, partial [Anaerolineae bacterium]|nr:hypothetical protein [Anaerolineae bacterium]